MADLGTVINSPDLPKSIQGGSLGTPDSLLTDAVKEQSKIRSQQAAETAPLEAGIKTAQDEFTAKSAEPLPKPDLPTPPKHVDQAALQDSARDFMLFAALAGLTTRRPFTAAIEGMTGAINGTMQGDQDQYNKGMQEYKVNYDKAMKLNDEMIAQRDDILKNKRLTIQDKENELRVVNAKFGNQVKDLDSTFKIIDAQNKATELARFHDAEIRKWDDQNRIAQGRLSQSGASSDATPEAIDFAIARLASGDSHAVTEISGYNRAMKVAIANRIPEYAREHGLNPADFTAAHAMLTSQTGALRTAETRRVAVERLTKSIESLGPILEDVAKKGASSGIPLTNKTMQEIGQAMGDQSVTNLGLVVRELATQYQEALTMPGSNAQMHEGSREIGALNINQNMTYDQMMAAYNTMKRVITANRAALDSVVGEESTRIRAGNQGASPAPSQYKEGQTATGPGGKKMIFQGGAWVTQ